MARYTVTWERKPHWKWKVNIQREHGTFLEKYPASSQESIKTGTVWNSTRIWQNRHTFFIMSMVTNLHDLPQIFNFCPSCGLSRLKRKTGEKTKTKTTDPGPKKLKYLRHRFVDLPFFHCAAKTVSGYRCRLKFDSAGCRFWQFWVSKLIATAQAQKKLCHFSYFPTAFEKKKERNELWTKMAKRAPKGGGDKLKSLKALSLEQLGISTWLGTFVHHAHGYQMAPRMF